MNNKLGQIAFYLVTAFAVCMLFNACSPDKEVVAIHKGPQGADGSNGHSLVSQFTQVSDCTCDSAGGSALEIYLDMNDSLSLDEGDEYQSSTVICNGSNGLSIVGPQGEPGIQGIPGPQGLTGGTGATGATGSQGLPGPTGPAGAQGPQGVAGAPGTAGSQLTHVALSTSCTDTDSYSAIPAQSNRWIKRSGSVVSIYDDNDCGQNDLVRNIYAEHTSNGEAYYWFAPKVLGFNDNSGNLRLVTYN